MYIDMIKKLYDDNKMFNGKKLKCFLDPEEIRKHKYTNLPGDEKVIFGIDLICFCLITDKAIYYSIGGAKRMQLDCIVNWRISPGSLYLNGDCIFFGRIPGKESEAFAHALENIISEIFEKNEYSSAKNEPIRRKSISAKEVEQLYKNNRFYNGEKIKHYIDPDELSSKEQSSCSEIVNSSEKIIFVLYKWIRLILSDKALYLYAKPLYKRLALVDIYKCKRIDGKLLINDSIVLEDAWGEPQVLAGIEDIINGIIRLSADYSLQKQIVSDDTVAADGSSFTKCFTNGITEDDMFKVSRMCLAAYNSSLLQGGRAFVTERSRIKFTESYMGVNLYEKLLFKYGNEETGFYFTSKRYGFYNGGKNNVVIMQLSDLKSLTLKNDYQRVYLTINGDQSKQIEIIKPYIDACAFFLISLCYIQSNKGWPYLLQIIEQFRRLGCER